MTNGNKHRGMADLADEAAAETDAVLKDQELEILLKTQIDWDALRPKVGDKDTYDKLKKAVQEANNNNNDIALLRKRVERLGKDGTELVKKLYKLLT